MEYVYFIQAEHGGPVKIGHTKDLAHRLAELQSASPYPLVIRSAFLGSLQDETAMHQRFAAKRLHGEWFEPDEAMQACIDSLDPPQRATPLERENLLTQALRELSEGR